MGKVAHGHANEAGTSIMLYFRPDLVDMEKATCITPAPETGDFTDINRFTPISQKSLNATVSDATIDTVEKGEKSLKNV